VGGLLSLLASSLLGGTPPAQTAFGSAFVAGLLAGVLYWALPSRAWLWAWPCSSRRRSAWPWPSCPWAFVPLPRSLMFVNGLVAPGGAILHSQAPKFAGGPPSAGGPGPGNLLAAAITMHDLVACAAVVPWRPGGRPARPSGGTRRPAPKPMPQQGAVGLGPVYDGCIHHHWKSPLDVVAYMSKGWQEYFGRPGLLPDGGGMVPIVSGFPYHNPFGDKLGELDRTLPGIARAVLCHDAAMQAPALPNPYMALEVVRAVNRWTRERWLDQDERMRALILAPNQLPAEAAAEIRDLGRDERFAGVLMGSNGLSKPFGHPLYHPIYEAAAEMGLPVILHTGSDATPDVLTTTTAGGLPGLYSEYRALIAQPLMAHVVSFITQGVFVKYPRLRLGIVGAGVTWITALLWRFDMDYKTLRRETPWVTRLPSEYFRENVRVCTYPLDLTPTDEKLARLLAAVGGLEDVLYYGSGQPNWDADGPDAILCRLAPAWHEKVMYQNADTLFSRTGRGAATAATPTIAVGTMPETGGRG